jgi:hypothetical protein
VVLEMPSASLRLDVNEGATERRRRGRERENLALIREAMSVPSSDGDEGRLGMAVPDSCRRVSDNELWRRTWMRMRKCCDGLGRGSGTAQTFSDTGKATRGGRRPRYSTQTIRDGEPVGLM